MENITKLYTDFVNRLPDTCDDCRIYHDELSSLFTSFKSEITSYFCSKYDDIKAVYNYIRNDSTHAVKVNAINLDSVFTKYDDYSKGLIEFVNNTLGIDNTLGLSSIVIHSKMNAMEERDNNFVNSLFDFTQAELVGISEAMMNVECIEQSDRIFGKQIECLDKFINDSIKGEFYDIFAHCNKLYVKSVAYFDSRWISMVLNDFQNIQTALQPNNSKPVKYAVF